MIEYVPDQTGVKQWLQAGTYVVSRPKLTGFGTHYGVLATAIPPFHRDEVLHLTRNGPKVVTFSEFARGRKVRIQEGAPPEKVQEIIQRAQTLLRWPKPYDLVSNNCEHAARWIVSGKAESRQINGVGWALGIGLVALLVFGAK
jgi:hypothetical protein